MNGGVEWAAGLFEGEGFFVRPIPPGRNRGMEMRMKDRDVIEYFAAVVGVGRVSFVEQNSSHGTTPLWRWKVTRWTDTEPIIRAFLPYLGERRTTVANELLANPPRLPNDHRKHLEGTRRHG